MPDELIWIMTDEPAPVIVADGSRDGKTGNPFEEPETIEFGKLRRVPVSAEKLRQEVTNFLSVVGQVFQQAQQSASSFGGVELEEIELSVEVNGEGQLSLLGSGGKVGGKGAMKLKFKLTKPSNTAA